MNKKQNVYLVGPMGAGKTTIGRFLAGELKLEFKDADREIEDRCGADISWIFDMEGEEGFRRRETEVIEELSQQSGLCLATGGGAVMSAVNRAALMEHGIVVYLKTSVDQQVQRTSRDKKRPLLQTDNPRLTLEELMAKREPAYAEVADIVVETDERNPRTVALDIVKQLRDFKLQDSASKDMELKDSELQDLELTGSEPQNSEQTNLEQADLESEDAEKHAAELKESDQ